MINIFIFSGLLFLYILFILWSFIDMYDNKVRLFTGMTLTIEDEDDDK